MSTSSDQNSLKVVGRIALLIWAVLSIGTTLALGSILPIIGEIAKANGASIPDVTNVAYGLVSLYFCFFSGIFWAIFLVTIGLTATVFIGFFSARDR